MTSLHSLIDRAADRYPTRAALRDRTGTTSYRDLAVSSAIAAATLRARGISRGARVALVCRRDRATVCAFYGILRSGAAVVPLDAAWTDAVLAQRVELCAPALVVTPARTAGDTALTVDELLDGTATDPADRTTAEDPAYLVFTSGTTALPRLIIVTHGNVVHYISALNAALPLDAASPPTFGHVTTFAGDLGYTSLFAPLLTAGCTAIVLDEGTRDARSFWREMASLDVHWLKTTPSHFRALLEGRPDSAPPLRGLILGGEPLAAHLAARVLDRGVARLVINHYGPAETTIGTACHVVRAAHELSGGRDSVPIGRPLGHNRLRLDPRAPNCGADEGELIVSGPGVAAGYFRASGADAARFTLDADRQRSYRTGDICREPSPGVYEFVRRSDRQLKVRGYRVDPEHVEAAIESIEQVRAVAVLPRVRAGATQLIAAIVPAPGAPADVADEIARRLAAMLPDYLVPFAIVPVSEIPLTANGKRDMPRLNAVIEACVAARARGADSGALPPPDGGAELPWLIAQAWSAILGVGDITPRSDVFALGADSLSCMRLVSRLRLQGVDLPVGAVLASRTAAELAAKAARGGPAVDGGAITTDGDGDKHLSPAQRRFLAGALQNPNLWNQAMLLRSDRPVAAEALAAAAASVRAMRPLLNQRFEGGLPVQDTSRPSASTCFSVTELPRSDIDARAAISRASATLQHGFDLANGRVFHVHLFAGSPGVADRILLVAHHLVTDVLTWHAILEDLAAAYAAHVAGQSPRLHSSGDFWRWTRTVSAEPTPEPGTIERLCGAGDTTFDGVTSRILTWSRAATDALLTTAVFGLPLDAVLWSALSKSLAAIYGPRRLTIDVEQHGRPLDAPEYTGTAGWFTRVHSITSGIPFTAESFAASVAGSRPSDGGTVHADVSVNYVGRFDGVRHAGVDWTPAPGIFGPLRSPLDRPPHAIAATARVVVGRLIADLVFDRSRIGKDEDRIDRIADAFATNLTAARPTIHKLDGSTAGLIALAADEEAEPSLKASPVVASPRQVLLTGGTGFLGLYLLRALVVRGYAPIVLVRASGDDAARERLLSLYVSRFGRSSVDEVATVRAIAADLSSDTFDPAVIARGVGGSVAAIIHAAADTRLFADVEPLRRLNVVGTARMLGVSELMGCPPFHHVSTLAVAGYHPSGSIRVFNEEEFDSGQSFLTPYEETKFEAERLVRAAGARRRRVYIYRSGHIAADSRTARFQRDAALNRIYQIFQSYVATGAAPGPAHDDPIAFSHVDVVADAMTAMLASNAAPGTFHVESPYDVGTADIVQALRAVGFRITLVAPPAYVARVEASDLASAAAIWLRLPKRNVRVERTKTLERLQQLGVSFARPTQSWLTSLFVNAIDEGFLLAPLSSSLEAGGPGLWSRIDPKTSGGAVS